MCDSLVDLEVLTVDVYGFELCSMARRIKIPGLVKIVSRYIYFEGLILESLRLKEEAFYSANKTQKKQDPDAVVAAMNMLVEKQDVTIEKVKSLKVDEGARKLHTLMFMVHSCRLKRIELAFKVEESKIIEIVSRYRAAIGARLERLKKKREALLEKREFMQDHQFDFKRSAEEWNQIYALVKEIEETAARKIKGFLESYLNFSTCYI